MIDPGSLTQLAQAITTQPLLVLDTAVTKSHAGGILDLFNYKKYK